MLSVIQAPPWCASSTWDGTPYHCCITPHLIHHVEECIMGCAVLLLCDSCYSAASGMGSGPSKGAVFVAAELYDVP
eukprot:1672978-Amphidinium_carterae.1